MVLPPPPFYHSPPSRTSNLQLALMPKYPMTRAKRPTSTMRKTSKIDMYKYETTKKRIRNFTSLNSQIQDISGSKQVMPAAQQVTLAYSENNMVTNSTSCRGQCKSQYHRVGQKKVPQSNQKQLGDPSSLHLLDLEGVCDNYLFINTSRTTRTEIKEQLVNCHDLLK